MGENDAGGNMGDSTGAHRGRPTPASLLRWLGESRPAVARAAMLLLIIPWTYDGWTVLRQGLLAVRRPFITCVTELSIIDGARVLAQGGPLFPPLRDLPFSIHVYNVLNYLPAGLAGRLAGLSIDELMIATRVVPYLSALGVLVVVAWYARLVGGDWWVAALGVTMVLFFHSSTLPDFFRNRPETPGLLFSALGFVLCLARPRNWTVLAALSFTAAFGFKQSFLAAPAAAVIHLLIERRNPIRLVATSLAVVALFTLACRLAFGPGYFEHTYLTMADNSHDFVRGLRLMRILLVNHWGLLVVSAIAAAVVVRRDAIFVWLLVCLAWTFAIQGKDGADVNYYAELSLVMVLVVITALARLRDRPWVVPVVAPLFATTWIAIARDGPGWNEVCFNRTFPTPRCYTAEAPFPSRDAYIERYRGRTDALILDPEIGIRAGVPSVNDWYLLDRLFKSGFLSFQRLEDEIRSARPKMVVYHRGTPDIFDWRDRIQRALTAAGYVPVFFDGTIIEFQRP
jgi:hypothetical protein